MLWASLSQSLSATPPEAPYQESQVNNGPLLLGRKVARYFDKVVANYRPLVSQVEVEDPFVGLSPSARGTLRLAVQCKERRINVYGPGILDGRYFRYDERKGLDTSSRLVGG